MDRGIQRATVHGVTQSDMTEKLNTIIIIYGIIIIIFILKHSQFLANSQWCQSQIMSVCSALPRINASKDCALVWPKDSMSFYVRCNGKKIKWTEKWLRKYYLNFIFLVYTTHGPTITWIHVHRGRWRTEL